MDSPSINRKATASPVNSVLSGRPPAPEESAIPCKGGVLGMLTNFILDAVSFQQGSAWKAGHLVGAEQAFNSGRNQGMDLGLGAPRKLLRRIGQHFSRSTFEVARSRRQPGVGLRLARHRSENFARRGADSA